MLNICDGCPNRLRGGGVVVRPGEAEVSISPSGTYHWVLSTVQPHDSMVRMAMHSGIEFDHDNTAHSELSQSINDCTSPELIMAMRPAPGWRGWLLRQEVLAVVGVECPALASHMDPKSASSVLEFFGSEVTTAD